MDSLVSTDWLAARMTQERGLKNLVILDASRHLPASGRDARQEFEQAHIAGARYLDLANLTDPTSNVPAALPNADQLALRLGQLGIGANDRIILYDDSAVKTSARAWFALIAPWPNIRCHFGRRIGKMAHRRRLYGKRPG